MPQPVFPEDVRARMAGVVSRSLGRWLLDDSPVSEAVASFPLHPPTAKRAVADPQAATDFVRAWQRAATEPDLGGGPGGWTVEWESRSWSSQGLGTQLVPVRVSAVGAAAIARAAGPESLAEWGGAHTRLDVLEMSAAPTPENALAFREAALSKLSVWSSWDTEDVDRLGKLAAWFFANPESGLQPRAVAVPGIHGKWLEAHAKLVSRLASGLRGSGDGSRGDLGLAVSERSVRIRRLDPLLRGSEGLEDIAVPPSEAESMWRSPACPAPTHVLIVENLATFLALPGCEPGSGRVVVWGEGYRISAIARLPWLRRSDVIYWGDLDQDGFAILHSLRASLPRDVEVRSIMMDAATVERWADFGTPDPARSSPPLSSLTAPEEDALRRLITLGNLRIEQERIPWDAALAELRATGFLDTDLYDACAD